MNEIYVKFRIFASAKHIGKRYMLISMLMNLDTSIKGLWGKCDVLPFVWLYTPCIHTDKGRGSFLYPNPGCREPICRVLRDGTRLFYINGTKVYE